MVDDYMLDIYIYKTRYILDKIKKKIIVNEKFDDTNILIIC